MACSGPQPPFFLCKQHAFLMGFHCRFLRCRWLPRLCWVVADLLQLMRKMQEFVLVLDGSSCLSKVGRTRGRVFALAVFSN